MKSIVMPQIEPLQDETNEQLNLEATKAKEELAKTGARSKMTKFTAVDMWNRNRQSRSASSMMRWNLN